jgi:hypothetical protein
MQYSMFNLGRMRAGVLFVAAFAAFSAVPVSAQVEVTGRVKTTAKTVENGIPGSSNFIPPDPARDSRRMRPVQASARQPTLDMPRL